MANFKSIVDFLAGLRAKWVSVDGGTIDLAHTVGVPATPPLGFLRLFTKGDSVLWAKNYLGGVFAVGAGAVGTHWHCGSGIPLSSLGVVNDYYLDTASGYVYFKSNAWVFVCNLRGTTWLSGAGAPSARRGVNGDFYFNTNNGDVFIKQGGIWIKAMTLLTDGEAKGYTNFVGNLECGNATSIYGGTFVVDGGSATGVFGSMVTNYEKVFTLFDWVVVGKNWCISVPASTHQKGLTPFVQVKTEAGNVVGIETVVAGNGDVTIKVPTGGDQRFVGTLVIK